MRPVEKLNIGEEVSFVDSNGNVQNEVIKSEYKPYSLAKPALVANLGRVCSYCEDDRDMGDIHVEHVEAKSKTGNEFDWANFLLACNICNSVKSDKDCLTLDFHTPHRNNTFLSFVYERGGRVRVNPALTGLSKAHAEKLYDLVKLGRPFVGGKATNSDERWRNRLEAWKTAEGLRLEYDKGGVTVEGVIWAFKLGGCSFWSVWFTVFKGYDEILRALLDVIPGTCKSCFDAGNHYEPINRNPGAEDPV